MTLLHVVAGGWGFYRLMRAEGLSAPAAVTGGLAFALLPRAWAHFAAGHVTLVCAFCWTPWLLLAARRAVAPGDARLRLGEGALLALIVLADVRWAVYAGLVWAAYRLAGYVRTRAGRAGFARFASHSLAQGLLAALLSAPLLLPLAEYSARSTRAALQPADNLYLSLPPARLVNLLIPATDGNTEWTVYAGALAALLAVWALALPVLRRKTGFWLGVVLISLLFSLGAALPGMALLARLPGFSLLRVPPRFVLLAGLGLAAISAHGAAFFEQQQRVKGWGAYAARLACAGLAAFCALAALGVWLLSGERATGFLWAGIAMPAGAALALLRERGRVGLRAWQWGCAALLALDLLGISVVNTRFRPAQAVFGEGAAAAQYLAGQPGLLRVYSPSYSIPQQTAARFGLEIASGIDPLQLRAYARAMETASGVAVNGYGVTLPPMEADTPAQSNRPASPDADALGRLNVAYVAAEYDLAVEGLVFEQQFGETRIYRNAAARPRAWVEHGGAVTAVEDADITWTPNAVTLRAAGPGRLVLSEIAYPGWRAWVDGVEHPVETADGLLRSVPLGEGTHTVRFAFLPWRVFAGLGLAALGLIGWGILTWRGCYARSQ